MKKFIALVSALILLCLFGAVSCKNTTKKDKTSIVCTVFPVYDWVKNITKDNDEFSVELLIKNKTDMHSFQPSVEDMALIAKSDLFFYIGGESDAWVEKTLQSAGKNVKAFSLMELLGDKVKDEERIEGDDHDHDTGHEEEQDHEDEREKDEHIWLSLKNAKYLVSKLAEELSLVAQDKNPITENAEGYISELYAIDALYASAVQKAKFTTLLFGDRFPFLYLVKDYNLNYDAAFSGCSAETEASFNTIVRLAKKVDELSLPAIIKIDGSKHDVAETIKANTTEKNQMIITLDSMQSTTLKDYENGANYLKIARANLETLKIALGVEQ